MANNKKLVATTKKSISIAPVVLPAVSVVEAKKAWGAYQELKKAIIEPSDVQLIQKKEFLKKSYWRKLATFFNLSIEIVEERKEDASYESQEGKKVKDYAFHFTCKAIAPNSRYAIGTGSCSRYEKGYPNTVHNVRATAETRAFNRAVSNLVGGGDVSAEEIVSENSSQELTSKDLEAITKRI